MQLTPIFTLDILDCSITNESTKSFLTYKCIFSINLNLELSSPVPHIDTLAYAAVHWQVEKRDAIILPSDTSFYSPINLWKWNDTLIICCIAVCNDHMCVSVSNLDLDFQRHIYVIVFVCLVSSIKTRSDCSRFFLYW